MAPAREMTDQDLVRTYVDSQDVESLGVFFCRYKRALMRFVSNFLQDESAAQDIVPESFFRVARKPARLLDVNSCRNGLLKIALNLSIGHLRRSVRKKKLTGSMENGASLTAATSNDLNGSGPTARVRNEMARLRPRLRMVMLLKIQEGRSYREIAEITGLTGTNVGYLIHQAMKTLKIRLEGLRKDLS